MSSECPDYFAPYPAGSCSESDLEDLFRGKTVLVVEDDVSVIQVIADILCCLGVKVLAAIDGRRAERAFRAQVEEIDCIILDYEIPGTHVSYLVRQFRQINPEIKILLCSGYPEEEIFSDITRDCVDAFLPKPFESHGLIDQLGEFVC